MVSNFHKTRTIHPRIGALKAEKHREIRPCLLGTPTQGLRFQFIVRERKPMAQLILAAQKLKIRGQMLKLKSPRSNIQCASPKQTPSFAKPLSFNLSKSPSKQPKSRHSLQTSPSQQALEMITESDVINLLKKRSLSTKELATHFRDQLKASQLNKSTLFNAVKTYANLVNGLLVLNPGV